MFDRVEGDSCRIGRAVEATLSERVRGWQSLCAELGQPMGRVDTSRGPSGENSPTIPRTHRGDKSKLLLPMGPTVLGGQA